MAGLLSGLGGLGLKNLANADIYAENDEKEEKEVKPQVKEAPTVLEKDMIYEKTFECPVCNERFSSKIMKTGKAKLIGSDWDLRPKYEGIDSTKYEVILCPHCGYAALSRFFSNMTSVQAKLIKEGISKNVKLKAHQGEIYTFEEAFERYQLCLANAMVKRAKASEKAYICLKSAWLVRGYQESEEGADKLEELKATEEDSLLNAYNGFEEALRSENFPICGMDETTMNYLLAQLAMHFKKYDVASKLVGAILTSTATNARMKDKARDLKEQILAALKNK
ncbi:MAG: DUF2225 domain-containing protein [Candidatus Gastranaerophilales bacterium]|nr:DUF2225 domain-containing protein [Candidatus Gastranaerophilales bacterium]